MGGKLQTTRENFQLEVAVLVSLLLHVVSMAGWEYRVALAGFPLFKPIAKVLSVAFPPVRYSETQPTPQTITFVEAPQPQPPRPEPEPPRQFMETDNSQVTGEQPKDAKYYSDRSTIAANPVNPTGKTGDTPYLEGKETRVMSTENVVPGSGAAAPPVAPVTPPSFPAPPAPPSATVQPQPVAAVKPSPPPAAAEQPKEVPVKELDVAEEKKLAMVSKEGEPLQQQPAEAREPALAPPAAPAPAAANQPPASGLAGGASSREIGAVKSHLVAAGVSRIGVAAFNVEDSPFGPYDKQLIRAVQSRWYRLIDQYGIYERTGEVRITFELYDDGSVHDLQREQNTAGEILALFCEKAVLESAPFDPLPEKLRTLIGKEPREVKFTFYY